jgi:hypothetical protein
VRLVSPIVFGPFAFSFTKALVSFAGFSVVPALDLLLSSLNPKFDRPLS